MKNTRSHPDRIGPQRQVEAWICFSWFPTPPGPGGVEKHSEAPKGERERERLDFVVFDPARPGRGREALRSTSTRDSVDILSQ